MDSNTCYFHRMVDSRKSFNTINSLVDSNGLLIDSQQGILDHCVSYYEKLLGEADSSLLMEQEDMNLLLTYRCSLSQCNELERLFTDEEIKAAFKSLPRNKTSGPDGFSAEFFRDSWSIVGPEVLAAIREFFVSGQLLKQWNATTLVLIPKISNASSISDFRPISCLNTLYKVISKLLTGRLQGLLSEVIGQSQSAFLPGRTLAENVLLATEMVHGYNRQNISPRGMLKVDLRKAFDSVKWEFIIAALKALAIPDRFVSWIYQCISKPTFTVSVNGATGGFFKSSKGLRQGDPLSPYLFVLAMEVFSKLLYSRYDAGYIHYHPKAGDLSVSHLMFADDVMIFFDGGSSSMHGISETLDDFADWSGLKVNKDKSQLFQAGLDPTDQVISSAYGFPLGTLPIRYLGLPLMSRKLRIADYGPLLDKLSARFRSWVLKSMSFAGRAQLISSVIFGLINFWMSTFLLPKGCIQKLEGLCSKFLWSGNVDAGKGAKVSWVDCCLPKSEGGLGFRRFGDWNKTLLLRLVWGLFDRPTSLWTQWQRHHRLGGASFWQVDAHSSDPWSWKMLLNLRPLAEKFIKARVDNGADVSFWFDSWTPLGPLIKVLGDVGSRPLRIPIGAKVKDAYDLSGWRLPLSRSVTADSILSHLTPLPAPLPHLESDSYYWSVDDLELQGYSAASTWEALRPRRPVMSRANSIWFKGAVPKHASLPAKGCSPGV